MTFYSRRHTVLENRVILSWKRDKTFVENNYLHFNLKITLARVRKVVVKLDFCWYVMILAIVASFFFLPESNLSSIYLFIRISLNKCFPAGIYLLKVNSRSTRTSCEICSKLTIKISSGIFIVNFEHISHLVLVFL